MISTGPQHVLIALGTVAPMLASRMVGLKPLARVAAVRQSSGYLGILEQQGALALRPVERVQNGRCGPDERQDGEERRHAAQLPSEDTLPARATVNDVRAL